MTEWRVKHHAGRGYYVKYRKPGARAWRMKYDKSWKGQRGSHLAERWAKRNLVSLEGDDSPTIAAFGQEWLDACELRKQHRVTTTRNFRSIFKRHIVPAVGSIPILSLDRRDCKLLLEELGKKGLAQSTVAQACWLLSAMFSEAAWEAGIDVTDNPAKEAARRTRRYIYKAAEPRDPLPDIETLHHFLETSRRVVEPIWTLYFNLQVGCGLRTGEQLAVRFEDFDFEKGILSVCRQLVVSVAGAVVTNKLKSGSAYRDVNVTPDLLDAILELRGQRGVTSGYLFESQRRRGRPHSLEMPARRFRQVLEAMDKRFVKRCKDLKLSPYSLRHSFATFRLEARHESLTLVSGQLGHSDTRITRTRYARKARLRDRAAAEEWGRILQMKPKAS